MIVRLLGAAWTALAAWQLLDRNGWNRFWASSRRRMRKPTTAAKALAAGELLLGAWLAFRGGKRRYLSGEGAEFRRSPGHHPITAA